MVAFLDVAAIDEQRKELVAEMKAIIKTAKDEDRELLEDESARIDEIQGENGEGGLLAKLDADHQRKSAIEANMARRFAAKIETGELTPGGETHKTFKIPIRSQGTRKLVAYENEKDAFVAGHFFLANLFGNSRSRDWLKNNGFSNVMSSSDNSLGGYLTTTEMSTAIIRLRESMGVFPQFARRWPMGADIMTVPRLLADVTAYWVGQSQEITNSDPTLGEAELSAKKLAALTRMPTELDEDSVVDIGEIITTSMAYAAANKIDDAGFNGDGTSTYGGVVGLANALTDADPSTGGNGAVVVAETGNDAANNLDLLDFEKVMGQMPEYPGADPRWFMSKPVFVASWCRLQNAAGGNTNATLAAGAPPEINGYPVTFVNVMPKTTGTNASTIIAYFGDLMMGASYGTRRNTNIAVTTDRYFETDQIGIKSTERVAITVHERGDDIRQRPIIALKTAA